MGYKSFSINGKQVANISINGRKIWQKEIPQIDNFYIESLEDNNSITLSTDMTTGTTEISIDLQYSLDNGNTWTQFTDTITNIGQNQKVYFKTNLNYQRYCRQITSNSNYKRGRFFVVTKNYNIGGYIASIYTKNFMTAKLSSTSARGAFGYLFYGSDTLISCAALIVPTTMANFTYYYMFSYCTNLVDASMNLNITNMASSNYGARGFIHMFSYCSSLISPPTLPATNLAMYCYQNMFQYCTSLVKAPTLPATTLTTNCYSNMFSDCSLLNEIHVEFTTWGQSTNWLANVSSTGDFYAPTALPDDRGSYYIPSGWTLHRTDA